MKELGLDLKIFIAQIINFGLFFYIYRKFVAKPFLMFIRKEKNEEEARTKLLEDLKKKEDTFSKKQATFEEDLRKKSTQVLEETRIESEKLKQEILKSAREEADEIKKRGKEAVEEEKEALYSYLRKRLITLSVSVVEEGLKDYLDNEKRREITKYIVKNIAHFKALSKNEN